MLIRFEATNYRSIAETVELSMVAVDSEREEARKAPMLGESLLPVAAIFGPNASGKSNVVGALAWVRDAVAESLRFWDDEIPTDPFAFGSRAASPSEFVVEAIIEGVRFEYVLEVERERILYEALFHYPEKKRRRIFEREESDLKFQRGLGNLSGTRELLTEKTLALSIARRFGEPLVSSFATEILNMKTMGLMGNHRRDRRFAGPNRRFFSARPTRRLFEETEQPALFTLEGSAGQPGGDRTQALAMLRIADLGIEDVRIEEQEVKFAEEVRTARRIQLVHKTGDGSAPLDFSSESEGTRTWFNLIGPVLDSLKFGSAMVFDELDASLHPTLSAELIRLFHSPVTNPHGAQLIFTSHDTSLLNHLNRDEVWLTEKRPDGSTRLGALADFAGERVRKSQDLESAYLRGRFGALPRVEESELLRALGLIG